MTLKQDTACVSLEEMENFRTNYVFALTSTPTTWSLPVLPWWCCVICWFSSIPPNPSAFASKLWAYSTHHTANTRRRLVRTFRGEIKSVFPPFFSPFDGKFAVGSSSSALVTSVVKCSSWCSWNWNMFTLAVSLCAVLCSCRLGVSFFARVSSEHEFANLPSAFPCQTFIKCYGLRSAEFFFLCALTG